MIRPSRSNMWTDCPIDCNIFKYCLSVKFTYAGPPPLIAPPATPLSPLLLSLCNGEEYRNDAEFFHIVAGSFLLGAAPNLGRRGDTECERWWLVSDLESLSLDISCCKWAWPASSSWIFLRSSSAGGVLASILQKSAKLINWNWIHQHFLKK